MEQNLYYNPNDMLSYNRVLNFIIGARGIGKSYSMKKYPIKRFLEKGEQFIYVRRYKDEIKKIRRNYFNDIMKEFPDDKFQIKGSEMMINGKVAGWNIPLSSWQSEKSNAYPNVTTIIFDEFIREKDNSGYIPNEVEALLNFMDTVFRDRDNVRCICLSNSVSVVNPYFVYFDVLPHMNKRFNAYKDILVEIPESKDFATERRKSRFGQLIDGTDYGGMSLDNEFVNDTDVFIEKRSKNSRFQFSIIYKGMTLGVWVDVQKTIMYLCTDHDPSTKNVFALTADDLTESAFLVNGWKDNYYTLKMTRAFKNGRLRFDNQVIRSLGYEIFKKMRVQ